MSIIKAITPSGLKINRHTSPVIAPIKLKINPKAENITIIARIINKILVGFIAYSPYIQTGYLTLSFKQTSGGLIPSDGSLHWILLWLPDQDCPIFLQF